MRIKLIILFVLIGIFFGTMSAFAQRDELRARFLERKPILDELKDRGIIGENNQGFIVFRIPSKEKENVVNEENDDRLRIYTRIAQRHGTDVNVVGRRRAIQIAKIAPPGHWLQDEDGRWYRKEGERHHEEPGPDRGWCCKNGDIFPASEGECHERRGRYFHSREEAERHCRERGPERGWCCKNGDIFPASEGECHERGGRYFPSREEAERHCRERGPERGWCCKDGDVFPASEGECHERGGRYFPSREEAERHCGKHGPGQS